MVDWAEFRAALSATRPYLLSHHEPAGWDRCYAPTLFGRRVRICARCLGVYSGIAAGLLAYLSGSPLPTGLAAVAALPLPALIEWTLTAFTDRRGYNAVRTATGVALGYAYGLGLGLTFVGGDPRAVAVGAGYALVAGALLFRRHARQ